MRHQSLSSQSSQPNLFLGALYPVSVLTLLTLYTCGFNTLSFAFSATLIVIGIFIATISMRRYRQRLNYVEGLERTHDQGLIHDSSDVMSADGILAPDPSRDDGQSSALLPHWIDLLGDRGVGLVSILMLTLVIPTLLATAHQLPSVQLFPPDLKISADYDLMTWVTVMALDTLGPIKLILKYLGFNRLAELGELGEQFSAHWQWFMALVQVGLISLIFDVFRRYLDLNSTLDRFASTLLISAERVSERERQLRSFVKSSRGDHQRERQWIHEYEGARNDLLARADTLARFLTVFSRRRMMHTLINAIDHHDQHPFSVEATHEGRGQLLSALQLAGVRSGPMSLAARIAQQSALRLLNVNVPVPIRLAALDTRLATQDGGS